MTVSFEKRDLQRLRYRQGQSLRSQDFNDQAEIDAQYRWWHNRALHQAFGVAQGLEYRQDGDRVVVGTGIAVDCFGRELVLPEDISIDIPQNVRVSLLLLAQYRESCLREDGLHGCGAPFLEEPRPGTLELTWKAENQVRVQDGVPIARLPLGRTAGPVLESARRLARPLSRPRVASGATIPGGTLWERWAIPQRKYIGIQVRVDTSAAGFISTPCYFVQLHARHWEAALKPTKDGNPVVTFEHIDQASASGFIYRVFIASVQRGGDIIQANLDAGRFIATVEPYICWIGVVSGEEGV